VPFFTVARSFPAATALVGYVRPEPFAGFPLLVQVNANASVPPPAEKVNVSPTFPDCGDTEHESVGTGFSLIFTEQTARRVPFVTVSLKVPVAEYLVLWTLPSPAGGTPSGVECL